MALVQLEFFENPEISALRAEIQDLREKLERQRKSQFAKIGANAKEIAELKLDMELLKRNICNVSK